MAGAMGATAASAELPRGYDTQRVDSPSPRPSGNFGFLFINGGDLDADGFDDLLMTQNTSLLNDGNGALDGDIHVTSSEDGSLVRTIPAPEPEPAATGSNRRPAFGTYVSKMPDIGSCPGGEAGEICTAGTVGAPDDVPEIVASAPFVDVPTPMSTDGGQDIGRVYVLDGATGAVLKRIDMPEADRIDQDTETERLGPLPRSAVRPVFGRTVLVPAGQSPCEGNAGVGPCSTMPEAVRIGDLDGGGEPDIIVGASFFKDDETSNPGACSTPGGAATECARSGRVYMYRGEEIVGTDPAAILEDPAWNIANPVAQPDPEPTAVITELELFGHSVAPVGDVGGCTGTRAPGETCPVAEITGTPDGRPEILVSAFRVDYPLGNPSPDQFDIGVNLLLDGRTGAVLQTYFHPEPQAGSIFGFTLVNQPAVGDMGSTAVPDIFLPAAGQTVGFEGQGRGYLLNGGRTQSPNTVSLQSFNDPTPQAGGGFGISSAGVGNVAGDPRNEMLVGEFASHNPPQNTEVISDVHIFDPITSRALQTISDPDQQRVSTFGASLAPIGDVNGDGFLDFAVGAGRHDADPTLVDTGRLYIFRSNDTNPPPPPPPPPPPAVGGASPQAPAGPPAAPAAPPGSGQPVPPVVPLVIFPAKVEVERARVLREDRRLSVLAPITGRASGEVEVEFFAAQERVEFEADVDAENRRVRFNRQIPANQARLGTGIVTITYPGDGDTRPQEVRLRAASQKADLDLERPVIEDGRLKAEGTISTRARGVVRLQLQYVVDGETETIELRGEIDDGRWEIDDALSQEAQDQIARRTGTVHSYTLFTGFFERRIRGEMQSFQVLGDR
jgi:hypothetical protein